MVLVQKWPFFQLFLFQAISARKMSFTKFYNEKIPFLAIKTRSSKRRKIDIFPKGLNHGFGPKMANFPTFFFQAIQAGKMSFPIFQKKKSPFQAIKTRSSNSRKIDIFCKGVIPWFWSKKGHFSKFFFRQYRPGKCLLRYLERKKAFLRYKNKNFKSRKIDIFPTGYPWFKSKNCHFSNIFFQAKQARKMSFTIFQNGKKPFQAIETRILKN